MFNKYRNLLLGTFIVLFSLFLLLPSTTFAARQKHSVLTVYENKASTTYDADLDKIVNQELQRRLEGLYIELDSSYYRHILKRVYKAETLPEREMINLVKGSGADYFIYLELKPLALKDYDHVLYYHMAAASTVFMWIIDLNNNETLYKDYITLGYRDVTGGGLFYSIGNKSVSKKALTATMYKAGEYITVKMPL